MPTLGKNRHAGFAWIGLLSLALATAGCSHRRENADIASDVQNRIRSDVRMQMARVQVIATAGVVTLSGYVVSPQQRASTVEDAARVPGVKLVVDNLRIVDPNSSNSPGVSQKPSASIVRLPAAAQARVPAARASERPAAIPQTRSADRAQAPAPIAVSSASVNSPHVKMASPTSTQAVPPSSSANVGTNVGIGAVEPRPSASTASMAAGCRVTHAGVAHCSTAQHTATTILGPYRFFSRAGA